MDHQQQPSLPAGDGRRHTSRARPLTQNRKAVHGRLWPAGAEPHSIHSFSACSTKKLKVRRVAWQKRRAKLLSLAPFAKTLLHAQWQCLPVAGPATKGTYSFICSLSNELKPLQFVASAISHAATHCQSFVAPSTLNQCLVPNHTRHQKLDTKLTDLAATPSKLV